MSILAQCGYGRANKIDQGLDDGIIQGVIMSPRDGHLGEYDYYGNNSGISRTHFSGSHIRGYVKECLDYQFETFGNDIAYIVSPTIL